MSPPKGKDAADYQSFPESNQHPLDDGTSYSAWVAGISRNEIAPQLQSIPFEDFSSSIMQSLQNLLHSRLLTDVTIRVEAEKMEWKMHRVVLSAAIPYFRSMFTGKMAESQNDAVVIQGVDGECLGRLLNYAYSGEVEVNEKNVVDLLNAANLLEVKHVIAQCCEFLKLNVQENNCLEMLEVLKTFRSRPECEQVYQYAQGCAMKNFEKLYPRVAFKNLSLDLLRELLLSDFTLVYSEEIIFYAAVTWITEERERFKYSLKVFECVRFPLMESRFLAEKVQTHFIIKECPEIMPLLLEAYQFMSSQDLRMKLKGPRFNVRRQPPKLYAVGGHDGTANLTTVECYDPKTCQWTQVSSTLEARNGHAVASCGWYVYAVGGYDALHQRLRTVERYNPQLNVWTKVTSMKEKRSGHSCAVLDGNLYAIGGYDAIQQRLNSVEKYDPNLDTWAEIASMFESRSGHGSGVLNGKLYAVGGYNGRHQRLCSVEEYDPQQDVWTTVASMKDSRSGHGVAGLAGYLYAVGGHNGKLALSSVEKYDPLSQEWTSVADMLVPRSTVGIAVIDGLLYALGGHDGRQYISSVEYYDPATNQWLLAPNMANPRASVGAVDT